MNKLIQEFRDFAFKGNVVDLAVAVIIGGAFGKVVNSLVQNILMPLLSYVSVSEAGDYRNWKLGRIEIGIFLGEFIQFVILAFAVFILVVKTMSLLARKRQETIIK